MAHTPGPWGYGAQAYIENVIADVGYWLIYAEVAVDEGADEANANLIAASPDLLAICKVALPLLERFFEELKVTELDEMGRCPACNCYDDYCSNHKLQHDLLNVIPSIIRDIARAEGNSPACVECHSVFQDGEPQRSGDDGPLCLDCYAERHGARDAADEPWVRGDMLYDEGRLRDG